MSNFTPKRILMNYIQQIQTIVILPEKRYSVKEACIFLGIHRCPSMTTSDMRNVRFLLSGSIPIKEASYSREATCLPIKRQVSPRKGANSKTAHLGRRLSLNSSRIWGQFHWFQGKPASNDFPSASLSSQASSHASVRMVSMSFTAC